MRIFYSFLIIVCSTILILLPVSKGIYDFRTDQRTDTFTVMTSPGANSTTVQLFKTLYDDDTSTISLFSYDVTDTPLFSSYNTTTRALVITGLSGNATRPLDVIYDVEANGVSPAMDTFLGILPWVWILIWVAFPVAGLAAIWLGKAE